MTIRRGEPWGVEVPRPVDVRLAHSDRDIAATDGPVALAGGDIFRTLGSPAPRDPVLRVDLDAIEVDLGDGRQHLAAAHVVIRRSWWRGRVIACMNADHIGDRNVAPRAHPNDGVVDVVECDPSMRLRDRWTARARLAAGTHLPHPDIHVARVTERSWRFDRAHRVWVDGVDVGRSHQVEVRCVPDRFVVLF